MPLEYRNNDRLSNELFLSLLKRRKRMTTFNELGIKESILNGIKDMGFSKAFPIQEAAIPALLSGRDVVGQAHTGTGKTAAFAISMLQHIIPKKRIQGLVIAPSRTLYCLS